MIAERFFFSNCINLYILNEALGCSTSVLGLHASGFCRDIMVVFSKDWFNQTKSPNLESNPNLTNQIHSAKHVSLWFMAKRCLHCHRVKKVWRIFLGNSAELGRESGKGNLLLLLTPQSGHSGTVKAVVGKAGWLLVSYCRGQCSIYWWWNLDKTAPAALLHAGDPSPSPVTSLPLQKTLCQAWDLLQSK